MKNTAANNNDNKSNDIKKYVRVKKLVHDKFIEFDFAINDPTIFVELVLPIDAYKIFCETNNVIELTEEQGREIDSEMEKWRYGKNTLGAANKNL
jgi:phenol hydroxylase P0 protein